METPEVQRTFEWERIVNLERQTYTQYLKLDKKQRDKYHKHQVAAQVGNEQIQDLDKFGIDTISMIKKVLMNEQSIGTIKQLLQQMKYHCGKPLQLTLTEKGPSKYMPLIDYFERNKDYLKDYDYMILPWHAYSTLLEEDFLLFHELEYPPVDIAIQENPHGLNKVGKLRNLDIYVSHYYPIDISFDSFDFLIGKSDWIDVNLIDLPMDKLLTKPEDGKDLISNLGGEKIIMNQLIKIMFPVKRGFMRIHAAYKKEEENGTEGAN